MKGMRLVPALSQAMCWGKTGLSATLVIGRLRGASGKGKPAAASPLFRPTGRPEAARAARRRLLRLDGASGKEHLVALVAVIELVAAQAAGAQALQECRRREHVAIGLDGDVLAAE